MTLGLGAGAVGSSKCGSCCRPGPCVCWAYSSSCTLNFGIYINLRLKEVHGCRYCIQICWCLFAESLGWKHKLVCDGRLAGPHPGQHHCRLPGILGDWTSGNISEAYRMDARSRFEVPKRILSSRKMSPSSHAQSP